MIKLYYAYVVPELVDKFDERLNDTEGIIRYKRSDKLSYTDKLSPVYAYVIMACEGIINPEYEFNNLLKSES